MKEYEKLALKEASYQCTTGNEHFDAARSGYIVYGFERGFLKAREMVIDYLQNEGCYEWDESELKQIGEKEV